MHWKQIYAFILCRPVFGPSGFFTRRAVCQDIDSLHSFGDMCALNRASQVALVGKNLPASAGDIRYMGSVPGLGRSPRGRHGNPLQYSCLENSMDRGAWQATVHRVTQSQTRLKQLSMHARDLDILILTHMHAYMWCMCMHMLTYDFFSLENFVRLKGSKAEEKSVDASNVFKIGSA